MPVITIVHGHPATGKSALIKSIIGDAKTYKVQFPSDISEKLDKTYDCLWIDARLMDEDSWTKLKPVINSFCGLVFVECFTLTFLPAWIKGKKKGVGNHNWRRRRVDEYNYVSDKPARIYPVDEQPSRLFRGEISNTECTVEELCKSYYYEISSMIRLEHIGKIRNGKNEKDSVVCKIIAEFLMGVI